jgi:cobalt-zinc-cadmium efflux system outer membrane protein
MSMPTSHFSLKLMKSILFLLLCASPAAALTLPLSGIAARVRTHHPMLKAARLAIEEARGRLLGSGRLANPTFGYDFQIRAT